MTTYQLTCGYGDDAVVIGTAVADSPDDVVTSATDAVGLDRRHYPSVENELTFLTRFLNGRQPLTLMMLVSRLGSQSKSVSFVPIEA